MNPAMLLVDALEKGLTLQVEDGELRLRAPKGALPPTLRQELAERRAELVALLEEHKKYAIPSFAQQRLWFLDQWEPGNPIYNVPEILHLTGPLDVPALTWALDEVVRRHETLRTTFTTLEGHPVQVIAPAGALELPVLDLCGGTTEEREARVRELAYAEVQHAFDLSRGPLFRASLLCLGEEEHLLFLNVHHVVADGWSMGLLVRDLTTLYQASRTGQPVSLPDLPIQYASYAAWQRAWLQGETLDEQLAYWKQQLGGDLPVLDLPTDHPRPPVQTYHGAREHLTLPPTIGRSLRALGRSHASTLFMTLLAAFQALLARLSGQDDVLVGSPIAGRDHSQVENLVGLFLNTLVLRTDLAGDPSFVQLLQRVREVTLGAYAHQQVPFEKILEELRPARDLSRTPFFQVFFNMLNFPEDALSYPDLQIEPWPLPDTGAKFDLTLYLAEAGDEIQLALVYNADLFAPARMVEFLAQFQHLLRQVTQDPHRPLSRLSLVTPAARPRLPEPTRPLRADWPGPVHELFARQAHQTPAQLACLDPSARWTYAELDARSNQLAHALRDHGLAPQQVVALYAHRSATLAWAVLGVLKAGGALLLLDPAYPAARLLDGLRLVQPAAWLELTAAGPLPEALAAWLAAQPRCARFALPPGGAPPALAAYPDTDPAVPVGPDDLACVGLTSGSLGRPKAVLGRHGPLTHFLPAMAATFGLAATDRYSMLSGLAHDPLQRDLFTPLALGATLCVPDPAHLLDPPALAAWLRDAAITVANLTPAMLQLLTQPGPASQEPTRAPALRYAFVVGDALTRADVLRLQQFAPHATCVNLYGATETQRAVGHYVVRPGEAAALREVVPLGRGFPDVQLLVLTPAQELAGVGEPGEIYLRSPHLARGYLGDDALTRRHFLPNPFTGRPADRVYRTGDRGRYLPDGNVEFAGRADDQVKVRGFRVELSEIAAVLRQHPAVREAALLALPDPTTPASKRLVAYVVPRDNVAPLVSELRRFLGERLPDYMVPAAWVTLAALPLTPNGKLDRRALPVPDGARPALESVFVAPRTPTEQALAEIWAELLALEQVGVHDNFFELGGHSLLATQVISRVRDRLQVELPLRALFEAPTIAGLAQVADDRPKGQSPGATAVPTDVEEVSL